MGSVGVSIGRLDVSCRIPTGRRSATEPQYALKALLSDNTTFQGPNPYMHSRAFPSNCFG